ncbi:CFEM domain-containing protein [Diplogelasinospora grovesii]|uniref:CFEM domain-containing protein n=1 Tax=Diplogelasinospora grovesii TaxID=303347 RepID=A0AAN6MZQ3_9PEZI|nr:CFEM domain-containing protein [Diplogelasinospora grovesii]
MKFLLATAAAIFAASGVMAQSSTACAAEYIVTTCLGTQQGRLASCNTNDYVCQCQAYGDIHITCFNNCPNDPRQHDYAGQKQIFCGYASQFPSSTTKAVAAATGSASTTLATADATATTASGSATGSSTATGSAASASATKTNNAADLGMKAGSVLAAVAGVVVAVL